MCADNSVGCCLTDPVHPRNPLPLPLTAASNASVSGMKRKWNSGTLDLDCRRQKKTIDFGTRIDADYTDEDSG
jgi:hypothetical protein